MHFTVKWQGNMYKELQIKIGTRASPLARYQAKSVQAHLLASAPTSYTYELCEYTTTGDRLTDHVLGDFGGKGLFTKELEQALLAQEVDMVVHSMKDVPTVLHEDLEITAVLARADVRDALISHQEVKFEDLPKNAVLGTASLRRRAQALRRRPDLCIIPLRGNVGTRLTKIEKGVCSASFLALAGLERLQKQSAISEIIATDIMLPAPAQGVIGIEIRKDNDRMRALLACLHDEQAYIELSAERAFLHALNGSCRLPIAALARYRDSMLYLRAQVLSFDGQQSLTDEARISLPVEKSQVACVQMASDLGQKMGENLRAQMTISGIVWPDNTDIK